MFSFPNSRLIGFCFSKFNLLTVFCVWILQIFLQFFSIIIYRVKFVFSWFISAFVLRRKINRGKMQKLLIVCFSSLLGLSLAQFPNGRILEPPVPALCANRVIHERAPDGKGYIIFLLLQINFLEKNFVIFFHWWNYDFFRFRLNQI